MLEAKKAKIEKPDLSSTSHHVSLQEMRENAPVCPPAAGRGERLCSFHKGLIFY